MERNWFQSRLPRHWSRRGTTAGFAIKGPIALSIHIYSQCRVNNQNPIQEEVSIAHNTHTAGPQLTMSGYHTR